MNDRRRRIARARLLRRQGKTYNEIRVIIGPVDDKTLLLRCKGIPRPAATYRSHPKDDVRRECRRLRAEGLTIPEIAEKTSASKGSISPWVADARVPRAPPPDVGRTTTWRDAGQGTPTVDGPLRRGALRRLDLNRLRHDAAYPG